MDIDTDPKGMARRLRTSLADLGLAEVSHSQALELVARALGVRNWNTLAARPVPVRQGAIPILRIFDREQALGFYRDTLGFQVEREEGRADLHEPVRLLVSRESALIQLSEHYDDASPGGAAIVPVPDVAEVRRGLVARGGSPSTDDTPTLVSRAGSPSIEDTPSGRTLVVVDPFRNRLVFAERSVDPAERAPAAGPIEHELIVPCGPEQAFQIFTARIGEWWNQDYAPGPLTDVRIEPRVGGAATMHLRDGSTYPWGTVTVWEPPHRYAQEFTLAQDANHPSSITVTFDEHPDGTRVLFRHGGWTAGNLASRNKFTEWLLILSEYVRLTEQA